MRVVGGTRGAILKDKGDVGDEMAHVLADGSRLSVAGRRTGTL